MLISGTKAAADDKGAHDAALSTDDCLQRRNELVSSFIAGFVALLKKRDPEVPHIYRHSNLVIISLSLLVIYFSPAMFEHKHEWFSIGDL